MTQDEQLNIEELVESYRDYMGSQAQEIVILKTRVRSLENKLKLTKEPSSTEDLNNK